MNLLPNNINGWMIIHTRLISPNTINEVYEVIINYQQNNGDLIIRYLFHFDPQSLQKYHCEKYSQFLHSCIDSIYTMKPFEFIPLIEDNDHWLQQYSFIIVCPEISNGISMNDCYEWYINQSINKHHFNSKENESNQIHLTTNEIETIVHNIEIEIQNHYKESIYSGKRKSNLDTLLYVSRAHGKSYIQPQ